MNVTPAGAASPSIYQQASAPTASGAFESQGTQLYPIPFIDDLWVDTLNHLLKQCTSVNPYTWVAIGGGSTPNFADAETPSGSINSANKAFTLAFSPNPAASLLLTLNGVTLIQGSSAPNGYALSNNSITMVVAPASGDVLLAWYRH